MRERVLNYLEEAGRPIPAAEILQDVLGIRSLNERIADKILKSIVGRDPRFRSLRGLWTSVAARPRMSRQPLGRIASLSMESGTRPGCTRGALHLAEGDAIWEFDIEEAAAHSGIVSLRRARSKLSECTLLAWSPKEIRLLNHLLRRHRLEEWQGDSLCLRDLAVCVLGRTSYRQQPEDIAARLEIPAPDREIPARMARFLSSCLPLLLERVPAEGRTDLEALKRWIDSANPRVDFSRFGFGPQWLRTLPEGPGVYVMRNRASDIIYVGKSKNLRRRVRSYFTSQALADPKARRIHEQVHTIEFIVMKSEVEALLMEMRMIRDFKPRINLQHEVHEQPGSYGKESNLLLLVPEEGRHSAKLYFLHGGSFVGQQSVVLGRKPSRRVLQKIRSAYFASRRPGRSRREPWEIELVFRWLAANRRRLNYVDVDEAGSFEAVTARLAGYLKDPGRLREKVLYL